MRHQAREIALQMLFQNEFGVQAPMSQVLELYENSTSTETLSYARLLVKGVQDHQTELDEMIQSRAVHWKLPRMALVDKNVLRICLFEMHFSEEKLVPKIAINEAVELAKKYGTTDSGGFVNGVLDSLQPPEYK